MEQMRYGRYEIVRELGRGTMGVVYLAHDPQIDRPVALKVLRAERVTSEEFVARFLKEAKAIGRLSHPNIVTVYDVGRDHGTIYIAMEYLQGRPLSDVIQKSRPGPAEIVQMGAQVAETLNYAHTKGIVHRDIKPSNIVITDQGQVSLTDFGIAHVEDPAVTRQTQAGEILGTPAYMAPEQVMGQVVDGRSDLYSLGVILYELAVGQRPFAGDNLASMFRSITQDTVLPPCRLNPSLPGALSDVIVKSLARDPRQRYQSGSEMAQALRQGTDTQKTADQPHQQATRVSALFKRTAWAVALMMLLALGAYWAFRRPPKPPAPNPPASTTTPVKAPADQGPVPEAGRSRTPSGPGEKTLTSEVKAALEVNSSPSGARVYIGKAYKGKTPMTLELPLGKYEVRLNLPDHYEWEAQIQLTEPGQMPLFVNLIPNDK